MGYRFRKLYADVLAPDGTVCILYWTQSTLFGRTQPQAGIEIYRPDGSSEIFQAAHPHQVPDCDGSALRMDTVDGSIIYEPNVEHFGWRPCGISELGLDWSIAFARGNVELTWTGDSGRAPVRGVGYADRVELQVLPRRLGLRRLSWGRLHGAAQSFVYTDLQFADGKRWGSLVEWSSEIAAHSLGEFIVDRDDAATTIEAPECSIVLTPARILRDGNAIEAGRFPRQFERILARAVAGRIWETRWLSRVRISTSDSADEGYAIHEEVVFGSPDSERGSTPYGQPS